MVDNFEGPEKNLIIYFSSLNKKADLRNIERIEWDRILLEAKCAILSKTSTKDIDSYVLSESSLFVEKTKIVIKTCGTTALLHCLNPIVELATTMSFSLETFCFFRKNFEFPQLQEDPHQSFSQECTYMNKIAQELGLVTAQTELGSDNKDSCYLFIANNGAKTEVFKNRVYVLMYGMSESASRCYMKTSDKTILKNRAKHIEDQVTSAGIALKKDDFLFDPCGYSMNALYEDGIATVHITPEEACSYASYETDVPFENHGLTGICNKILGLFKPKKYSIVLIEDAECQQVNYDIFEDESKVVRDKLKAGKCNLRLTFCSKLSQVTLNEDL